MDEDAGMFESGVFYGQEAGAQGAAQQLEAFDAGSDGRKQLCVYPM